MRRQNKLQTINCLIIFCLLAITLLSVQVTYAQCEEALSIESVKGVEGNNFFFVRFGVSTNWKTTHKDLADKARKPGNWSIFSQTLMEKAKAQSDPKIKNELLKAVAPDITTIELNGSRALKIFFSDTIRKGEAYIINVASNNDPV